MRLLITLLVIVFLWGPCEHFSSTPGCALRSSKNPSYYKEGDLMIGGIVQLYLGLQSKGDHHQLGLCDIASERYIRHAMALIFAVEQINKNPELLPNITLGYQIYDSCTSTLKAVQETLCILTGQRELVPNYSCRRKKGAFIGFIGDRSSETSYGMAQLIALYKYPQLNRFLHKMRFKMPDGDEVAFDESGDGRPRYDILNWVSLYNGTIVSIPVGSFDASAPPGDQLLLNPSSIIWHHKALLEPWSLLTIPRSVCNESCLPGTRKVEMNGKPRCCFTCAPCGEGEFSDKPGDCHF